MKAKMPVVICDLDGTLCDDRARRGYIDGKHRDYEAYHASLMSDDVNDEVLAELRKFNDMQVTIIYLTGRPEKYRSLTLDWFMNHDIPTGLLFMKRNDNTQQPAAEFKRDVVRKELKSFDIVAAFDDNSKVIEMYNSLGITTVEVTID